MKKLLKVLLPPLTGFVIYFLMVRFNASYFSLRIDEMGEGTLRAFMVFYKYACPLLFIIALLTQLLIINPIWNHVAHKALTGKLLASAILILVCILFAAGITYAISDTTDSVHHRLMLFGFMMLVQLAYWVVDLGILLLLN
jgi:hypothetical protein